jgi:hypothetical protein
MSAIKYNPSMSGIELRSPKWQPGSVTLLNFIKCFHYLQRNQNTNNEILVVQLRKIFYLTMWLSKSLLITSVFDTMLFCWYKLISHQRNYIRGWQCPRKGYLCLSGKSKENCNVSSFIICTPHRILLGRSKQAKSDEQGMWNAWGEEKLCGVLTGKHLGRRSVAESWHR